jgi:hypothetical protein
VHPPSDDPSVVRRTQAVDIARALVLLPEARAERALGVRTADPGAGGA